MRFGAGPEKLEPAWAAVARELGIDEATAQTAHKNCKLPPNINPAAAARFMTLPA